MKIAPPVCLALLLLLSFRLNSVAHAAASSVLIGQSCFSSGVAVAIAWNGGEAPVLQQYVDVSLEDNGWLPGTYSPQGPLAAGVTSVVLNSLPAGKYYVRVNQMLPNGTLEASETKSFVTMSCDTNPPVLAAANDAPPPQAAAPSTQPAASQTAPTQSPSAATLPDANQPAPASLPDLVLTSTPELAAAIALAAQLGGQGPVAPDPMLASSFMAGYPLLPPPYFPRR